MALTKVTFSMVEQGFANPIDYGAVGDGVVDDAVAVQAAVNTGLDVYAPTGYVFALTSSITGFVNGQRIFGGGTFKKKSGTISPIFLLPDESENVWFDGVNFDGTSASFTFGDSVSGILAYITRSLKVTNCKFFDIIDVGIKLRDGANLYAAGNTFFNIGENGIELHNYTVDVRTGLPYVGTRPVIEGNHTIIGNRFEKITRFENPLGPLVDCNAIIFISAVGYPQKNIRIIGNVIIDCLRFIWTESNSPSPPSDGVVISGNTMIGGVNGGTAENIYGKAGIGIIGGKNVVISDNTFKNIANHNPIGTETACIIVSGYAGATENIEIHGNSCVDDSGLADRTEWGIYCAIGQDIRIHNNYVSGVQNGAGIYLEPNLVLNSTVYANRNTEASYSWNQIVPFVFTRPSIAANQTVDAYPWGQTFDDALVLPTGGVIVAVSAKLSTTITAGNLTVKTFANGVEVTPYQITTADFVGGFAYKTGGALSQPIIEPGQQYKVSIVTDISYAPANNVIVTVFVDIGPKQ
jgi:hypothetical protein